MLGKIVVQRFTTVGLEAVANYCAAEVARAGLE